MNANELADLIEDGGENIDRKELATMLRQQQAEIEALKADNKELHSIAQRMAMAESDARKSLQNYKDCYGDGNVYRGVRSKDSEIQTIHFNPVKELTDDEIVDIGENTLPNEAIGFVPMWQWIDFAKAILRKAQDNG